MKPLITGRHPIRSSPHPRERLRGLVDRCPGAEPPAGEPGPCWPGSGPREFVLACPTPNLLSWPIRTSAPTTTIWAGVGHVPAQPRASHPGGRFLPITDLLFRSLHAFFVIEIASRRVVRVGVIRHPSDAWVAQQPREAPPLGRHPKHLILDNDSNYGVVFVRVAETTGIELVRTAYRAPKEKAIRERYLGSVRREGLAHLLVLGEAHPRRTLLKYVAYFNRDRPHQGLQRRSPEPFEEDGRQTGLIRVTPVLGGLHHMYHRAA